MKFVGLFSPVFLLPFFLCVFLHLLIIYSVALRHKHFPCATWKRRSISSGEDTQVVVRLHRGTLCKGFGRT